MNSVDRKKQQQRLTELARRIRAARKDAHLSQTTLGQSIGVSDKSVSAYEKGRSAPPFEKLKKIAQQTNRPLTYFTEEDTNTAIIASKLKTIEKELLEIKRMLRKKNNP